MRSFFSFSLFASLFACVTLTTDPYHSMPCLVLFQRMPTANQSHLTAPRPANQ